MALVDLRGGRIWWWLTGRDPALIGLFFSSEWHFAVAAALKVVAVAAYPR